jgi:DNA invertase Pin-like site-specific DNA recombinase
VAGITWGYSRVSTDKQDATYQTELLRKAGCKAEHIEVDVWSGKTQDRPAFKRLNAKIRRGDRVVLTQLSRAGRTQRETIDWLVGEQDPPGLEKRGIAFEILNMPFLGSGGSSMPPGIRRTVLELLGYLAEEEVADKAFRTKAGMRSRMAKGMKPGRAPINPELVALMREHFAEKGWPIRKIARVLGVAHTTVRDYVRHPDYNPSAPCKTPTGSGHAPSTRRSNRHLTQPKPKPEHEPEYAF